MPRAEQVRPNVLTTTQEIAGGFFLLSRNVNGREGAGAIQNGELARIAAVRLDAIASAPRNERWRNDVARNLAAGQRALELESARPGFVATPHRALSLHPRDESLNRRDVRRQRVQRWPLLPWQ